MCRSSRQRVQGRREYLGGGVILPMGYAPLPSRTSVSGVGHHARPIEKATIRSDPDANNANFDIFASGTLSWDSTATREDMTSSKAREKEISANRRQEDGLYDVCTLHSANLLLDPP
jgi:hypothetical protein